MSNTLRSPRASNCDYGDVTIGKTLLDSCQGRADHSEEEGLSSSLSSSVSHKRTVRPVVCSSVERSKETQRHNSESEQIRTLLDDKESRFSLSVKQRFENTNSRLIMAEGVYTNLLKPSSRKKKKFIVLIKETNDFDEINNFFMNNCWNKSESS